MVGAASICCGAALASCQSTPSVADQLYLAQGYYQLGDYENAEKAIAAIPQTAPERATADLFVEAIELSRQAYLGAARDHSIWVNPPDARNFTRPRVNFPPGSSRPSIEQELRSDIARLKQFSTTTR